MDERGSTALSSRDLTIRQNLQDFVQRNRDSRETLAIAWVGIDHSIDLFLTDPNLSPTFINKPFDLSTEIYSAGFRRYRKILNLPVIDSIRELSAEKYAWPYILSYESAQNLHLSHLPERTLKPTEASDRLLVFGEFHDVGSYLWLEGLPSGECLKAMGIRKVVVALEGRAKGRGFSLDDELNRRTQVEQIQYRTRKLNITVQELLSRYPKELGVDLLAGNIVDDMAVLKLVEILKGYSANGIEIISEGLEAEDYNELGD
jgi:hypothetical protein